MICPKCGADYKSIHVMDSRPIEDEIRRRRVCMECGNRFTTYEITAVMKAKYEKEARTKDAMVRRIRVLANDYAKGEA